MFYKEGEMSAYDISFTKFLRRVFGYMSGGLALSGLVAYLVANSIFIITAIKLNLIVFLIWFAFGVVTNRVILRKSAKVGLLMFIFFSLLTGLLLAPIIVVYTTASIATAFFVTAAIFGGMSLFGLLSKKSLSHWGYFLSMIFIGLVAAVILNIVLALLGVNVQVFSIVLSFLIVPAVAAGVAYEINQLKEIHTQIAFNSEETQKVAILGATSLYTSFVVMFVNILNIFNIFNR